MQPIEERARREGEMWRGRDEYYDRAEAFMSTSWNQCILHWIGDCDFSVVVDLAAGHGRNSARLLERAGKLYVVDLVEDNIAFCRKRFGDDSRIVYMVNNGVDLAAIPDASVTLLYTWDAMVHFDSDVVRGYLRETKRVLRRGGHGFFHHSNWTGNAGGFVGGTGNTGPHHRNFMHERLFAHYAKKEGLDVLRQQVIDWSHPELDCISLVQRPERA
jgi:ubiquinone/menaquinone biosynthesis C-methylase UbiE